MLASHARGAGSARQRLAVLVAGAPCRAPSRPAGARAPRGLERRRRRVARAARRSARARRAPTASACVGARRARASAGCRGPRRPRARRRAAPRPRAARGRRCAAAAQVRVRGADHVAQPVGPVGGGEVEPLGRRRRCAQILERAVEGVGASRSASASSSTLNAGRARRRAGARAAARAQKPWIVPIQAPRRRARPRRAQLEEAPPHALAQLARGLLGEREREDRVHRDAVVEHRLHEALDHHRGLAGAGVGGKQQRAVAALDRRAAARREVELAHSLARQIARVRAAAAPRAAVGAGAELARRACCAAVSRDRSRARSSAASSSSRRHGRCRT